MIGRLARDESGMTMGLTVIMVVLIGVMGAGLLVFVQRDLSAVVEVNQGQRAFGMADAGVQAAKPQLLRDACPRSYGGEEGDCEPRDSSAEWSESEGPKELELDGGRVEVTIRYLPFCEEGEQQNPGCAPEPQGEEESRTFFEVDAVGESGDAHRRVQAIYNTRDLGIPEAYYTPQDVSISGTADIENVSVFSGGDVDIGDVDISGEDLAYGDWENEFNSTPRETERAGIGAVGSIGGGGSERGSRDFDRSTDTRFRSPAADGEMTFPFDPESQDGATDERRIDFWRQEAERQGNHITSSGGKQDINDWPDNSDERTVVFVEFTDTGNNRAVWDVSGSCSLEDRKRGTLVVEGGDFVTAPKKALFSGAVVIRGGDYEEGEFDSAGNSCWEGFVIAEGDMTINGTATSFVSESVVDRPGFYGVEVWSWREEYALD